MSINFGMSFLFRYFAKQTFKKNNMRFCILFGLIFVAGCISPERVHEHANGLAIFCTIALVWDVVDSIVKWSK